jgi:acyl carrier protein
MDEPEIHGRLVRILKEDRFSNGEKKFNIPKDFVITPETRLKEEDRGRGLNLDMLDAYTLVFSVEKEFGTTFSEYEIERLEKIGDYTKHIKALYNQDI